MRIPLFIHELIHLTVSVATGFVFYYLYRNSGVLMRDIMIIAIIGGVLIDSDHLYDYFKAFKWDFKLHKFLKGKAFEKNKKIYVLFHGYEYVFLLVWLGLKMTDPVLQAYIFTLAISSLFHLIIDAAVNNVYIRTYSILYRIVYGFQSKHLSK